MISGYERHRKLQSRREFDFQHSGVTFKFRVPSELEFISLLGSIPEEQSGSLMKQASVFVPACLVGWDVIRACDIDPEDGTDLLPFDAELVPDVLDKYAGAIIPAMLELTKRYQDRRAKFEAETKNS